MSNQSSNPMSQYSGLNAPLIFPEKKPVVPTPVAPAPIKVEPKVEQSAPVVVAQPIIEMPITAKLAEQTVDPTTATSAEDDSGSFFGRMKLGLTKTRRG
jgi:hypothetical protein